MPPPSGLISSCFHSLGLVNAEGVLFKVHKLNNMLLTLNAYWFPDDYDKEEYEDMGKKVYPTLGEIVVNTNHIVAFHPHISGDCMIRLLSGDVFQVTEKYEVFKEIMFGEELSKDILSSREN